MRSSVIDREELIRHKDISIVQHSLKGVFPILLTPFDNNGMVDYDDLKSLVEYYLKSGIDGLACLGEVSETSLLKEEERKQILQTVLDMVDGRVPVVSGVGRDSEAQTIEAAKAASSSGVSGILVSPPRDLKAKEEELLERFKDINKISTVPIIILDNPSLGFPLLDIKTIRKIVDENEKVKYIKVEDQPSMEKIERIRQEFSNELAIFGASHGRNLLWEMELGIEGVLTSAPIPSYLVDVWKNFHNGNRLLARNIFYSTLILSQFVPERTIAVKKEILKHLGIIKSSSVRKPGTGLSSNTVSNLRDLIEWTSARVSQIKNEKV